MLVKDYAYQTTNSCYDPKADEVNRIRRKFRGEPRLSSNYTLVIFSTSDRNDGCEFDQLDAMEPKGAALDAIMALYPAPPEWYDE